MLLKHFLNASSVVYTLTLVLSIVETAMAFSLMHDTQKIYERDDTVAYFKISEIILPPMPSLQVLAMISYIFLIFLHGYQRKKLFFAMNPENKSLRQQPSKDKNDGFWFFTIFKSILITLFHALIIFFTVEAQKEYEHIDKTNNTDANGDLISRVHAIFALNIVSIILYYISVVTDFFVHREEQKLYQRLFHLRS